MPGEPRTADRVKPTAPDACDPVNGHHVFQTYVRHAHEILARHAGVPRRLVRPGGRRSPRPDQGDASTLLPALPPALADTALDAPDDLLLVMPGQVRTEGAEFPSHRLALVRISTLPLGAPALARAVPVLLSELLPGRRYRLMPRQRSLLREGMAMEILSHGRWAEIGLCGRLPAETLDAAGLPGTHFNAVVMEIDLEQLHDLRGPVPVR